MGCPYIVNTVEERTAPNGRRIRVKTGGKIFCPGCGGLNISTDDPRAPLGCACKDCGHVLCYIPKC